MIQGDLVQTNPEGAFMKKQLITLLGTTAGVLAFSPYVYASETDDRIEAWLLSKVWLKPKLKESSLQS